MSQSLSPNKKALLTRSQVTWLIILGIALIFIFLLRHELEKTKRAVNSTQCSSNLVFLRVALANYHDDHGCFPPAYFADPDGKPMHSWRALILPYFGDEGIAAYQQYDFSQPWNSPKNQLLANHAVSRHFRCPSMESVAVRKAHYFAIIGKSTLWPENLSATLEESELHVSETVQLLENTELDVQWLEPKDLTLPQVIESYGNEYRLSRTSKHAAGPNFITVSGKHDHLMLLPTRNALRGMFLENDTK